MMLSSARIALIALLSLGILACNLRDPYEADDKNVDAGVEDDDSGKATTAPKVVGHIPEEGAQNVVIGAPIIVEFSKPIDPTTVGDRSVLIEDSQGYQVGAERHLSADGKTLTVGITDGIIPPRQLTMSLSSDLTDLLGNPIEDQSFSWKVPTWIEYGDQLNSPGTRVGGSDFVFDDEKRLVATFFERADDNYGYLYTRRFEEGQWNTLGAGNLNHNIGESNLFSTARIKSRGGELFNLWTEGTDNLFMSRWASQGWQAVDGLFDSDGDKGLLDLKFLVDSQNRPVVSWKEARQGGDYSSPIRRFNGGEMETLSDGLFVGGSLFRHHLFITSDDRPVVVHNTFNDPNLLKGWQWDEEDQEFVSMNSTGGGLNIDANADARSVAAKMNDHDELFVVWHERSDSGATHRLYARRWDGAQISTMGSGPLNEDLDAELYGSLGANLEVALNEQGLPLVAWGEGRYFDNSVDSRWYVKGWNGTAWELIGDEPFLVAPGRVRLQSLTTTEEGLPLVATTVNDGDTTALYVHFFDGESWRVVGVNDSPVLEAQSLRFRQLQLLPNGTPLVFVEAGPAHNETVIVVLEYWNNQWHDLGDPSLQRDPSRRGNFHRIKTGPRGLPVMGWSEGVDGHFEGDLYFMKLNR